MKKLEIYLTERQFFDVTEQAHACNLPPKIFLAQVIDAHLAQHRLDEIRARRIQPLRKMPERKM